MAKPLAVIPTYVRKVTDLEVFEAALRTLRETAGDACDVMVVDDGSPERDLVVGVSKACERYDAEFVDKGRNEGYSRTINVGLRKALLEERDVITVNADIEFGLTKDWLGLMERQLGPDDKPASVVGGLLVYPTGLIQHAGIFFSFLTREFGHRYQFGPGNLAEAQTATVCPVTGALQFIRYECLDSVGLYDESFRLGWEDVDYCCRTWLSGRHCIYQPGIRALHHESLFRGNADEKIEKWTQESWLRFVAKYAETSFAEFVPNLLAA